MKKHEQKARSLAAMCCFFTVLVISSLFTSTPLFSQTMTVTPLTSTTCDTPARCCYLFKFEVSATTDYLEINVDNDACWDWTCFLNQTFNVTSQGGAVTVTATHVAPTPPNTRGKITLSFSAALTPSPAQVEFLLCPGGSPLCNPINLTYDWISKNGGTQNGSGDGSFNACPGSIIDCKGCDQTVIYRINDCIHDICYKRKSTSYTTQPIRFEFIPPLEPCGGVASGCSTTTIGIPTGFTATYTYDLPPNQNNLKYIVLTPIDTIKACDLVCITVPVCHRTNGGAGYKVKATEPGNPNDCGDYPESFFKKSPEGIHIPDMDEGSNYPNPVSSYSDFKTTIPFTLHAGTNARIKIYDVSGKLVHSETESFAAAGKHFFYFTGRDLPAGQYYYMIEAPLGAVIVQKTLLIVK